MRPEHLLGRAARQRQIADGERVCAARLRVPASVSERVELLDIAEFDPGLPLHPFAQADLQRAVGARHERAERQRVAQVFVRQYRAARRGLGAADRGP